MDNRNYKKAKATYDAKTKTLIIAQPKTEFIPSYAYYVCEYFTNKLKNKIEHVKFIYDNNKTYNVEELKGKYDWKDVEHELN